MKWKTLKSQIALKNHFFSIVKEKCKKTDGNIVEEHYIIKRPPVVVIAAFTKDKELVMIEQYRHAVRKTDFEIPAGYVEPHEKNIKKAALRELLEETGYSAKLKKIHTSYASAGFMDNEIHFFIGTEAYRAQEQNLDEHEEIILSVMPWKKALEYFEKGKIKDMASCMGILLAQKYLKSNPL